MPIVREKFKYRVQSMNGGENSTDEPATIKSPYATLCRNMNIDEIGKHTQREGLILIGDNPDKLISKWTFDDSSAVDDKEDNDGTETSISYVDGKFGKAASFNGTTSLITVAADTTLDVNSVGTFSISAWIYVNTDGENDEGRIVDKVAGTSAGYRFFVFGESGGTVKLDFEVFHGTTNTRVITSTTISTGTWHKVVAMYNSDKSGDIIINGVLATYSTDTTGVGTVSNDSANALIIGNRLAVNRTFDGYIDDLRFYNDSLSADEYEIKKIYGISRFHVGSTIDRLYRVRDIHIERLDDDFKNWTVVSSAFTVDLTTNFIQAKDKLFILNGTDNVYSMDTSEAFTDEGNTNSDPPRTTVGCYSQNNRLFVSGSLTDSQRDFVWFSDTLDPQTFDRTTNVFKVRSGGGGAVKWLQPFKLNEIIIYKEDSIFVLDMTGATPLTDWSLQPISTTVGTRAGRTVQDIGNDQIFLDDQKSVRLLQRTSFDKLQTAVISGPIQSILDEINLDQIDKCNSWFINGKYYLAIPTSSNTECDTLVVWDSSSVIQTGRQDVGWSVYPSGTWYVSCMTDFEFGDSERRLVVADNRGLQLVYKNSGNNDNGAAIISSISGPDHDANERGTDAIWGPLFVVFEAGETASPEIFAEIDRGGFISLGTVSLSGGAPILPQTLPFNLGGSEKATNLFEVKQIGRGKTCRIKIQNESYNRTMTFNEYELWGEKRIPRP